MARLAIAVCLFALVAIVVLLSYLAWHNYRNKAADTTDQKNGSGQAVEIQDP
jgi:hypothetical protein